MSSASVTIEFVFVFYRKVEDCDLFPGIIVSQKDPWMQQRRFTLKTLRDFGFGKQGISTL